MVMKRAASPVMGGNAAEWRELRGGSIRAGWARSRRSCGEIGWLLTTEDTLPAHGHAEREIESWSFREDREAVRCCHMLLTTVSKK